MTSTSFNVGLTDNTRLSSRVLRPPGGGHTDIFGGEPEPQPTGRRGGPAPSSASSFVVGHEEPKPASNAAPANQNGQSTPQEPTPAPVPTPEPKETTKPEPAPVQPAKVDPPKRVRVPPGGFSSGLCDSNQSGQHHSRRGMEGGRQSKLLGRLLGKLRGDHHKHSYNTLDKRSSYTSTVSRESTGCSTVGDEETVPMVGQSKVSSKSSPITFPNPSPKPTAIDDHQFAANIDLRYGGQYLTPEQLPEFCDQLHHLVEVIRNIQSYAKVTGEYPSELERRLEREALEVSALAAEARNAREVIMRTRVQRRAVRAHKKHLVSHLATLRESEVRELEYTVRLSDRKLFKSWEVLKDSTDPAAFDSLLDETKNKQIVLDCLVRLVENRRKVLQRPTTVFAPTPLPPPDSKHVDKDTNSTGASGGRKQQDARRSANKRRRRDTRSVPLSGEPSQHAAPPQVTLYIQGNESSSRYRVNSAGAVALAPLDLPSGGSVRDILFFTTN